MSVRAATANDVEDIARIHQAQFPTQFLARFSVSFVGRFYRAHLQRSIVLVHHGENGIDGFLHGGNPLVLSACRRGFAGRNLFACIGELALRPRLACTALCRTCGVLLRRRSRHAATADCCLRCIALDDSAMGKGVATALVDAFESRIRDQYAVYWAYVYKDNSRAIRFYEKNGFYVENQDDRGFIYAKRVKPLNAGGERG